MAELSKTKLASLEEDFRSYHKIPKLIAEILLANEWKPEDANAWIRGTTGHTEKALTDLIKREDNKSYLYYSKLYSDITRAYDSLNADLQAIVDEYLWGASDYLGWHEIAKRECFSTSAIYKKRYKILEALAIEQGVIQRVV